MFVISCNCIYICKLSFAFLAFHAFLAFLAFLACVAFLAFLACVAFLVATFAVML